MEEILLIGGGGHCLSCIDVIESCGLFSVMGIVDLPEKLGTELCGYRVLGTDADFRELIPKYKNALITVGHIRDSTLRKTLFEKAKLCGANFPVIQSSISHVSKHSVIGCGSIVMHNVIVNPDAWVGENCILNTGAVIEHGVRIGNHCHISTGALVNGGCRIEDDCFIGSGSVIRQGIGICTGTVIGAGTVVVHDIVETGVYVGNPARRLR